jgi:hypothetical protein
MQVVEGQEKPIPFPLDGITKTASSGLRKRNIKQPNLFQGFIFVGLAGFPGGGRLLGFFFLCLFFL